MTNITGNFEPFEKYIYDSSDAIFSEESNNAHDWFREVRCSLNADGTPCSLLIKEEECCGGQQGFWFNFNLELSLRDKIDKNKAKELICWIADKLRFHPNISVLDRTDEAQCWEGIPEYFWADRWTSNMLVTVKMAPSKSDEWGCSFDLGPEALDPSNLLRRAIRKRDEKIAAEEARKRAEREAEIARIKAIKDANRKNYEEFKNFVNEIGDFELNEGHCTSFGDGGWKPLRDFAFTWTDGDNCSYRRCDGREFSFYHEADLDWHKNEVVRWAVENGAREPQQACV
jgi:hypothetical protein